MKNYLKTIHHRSPAHKQRFALVVSGGTTLMIFAVWSLVVFGGQNSTVANDSNVEAVVPVQQNTAMNAVAPFDDIRGGLANSIDAVKQQFVDIKNTVQSVNVESKYQEVRDQALSNN